MAMANSVKTVSFTNTSDYLIAPELAFALSCVIGNTGVTANANGRKIIKAGTPLYIATGKSVLEDRAEVLTVSSYHICGYVNENKICGIFRIFCLGNFAFAIFFTAFFRGFVGGGKFYRFFVNGNFCLA